MDKGEGMKKVRETGNNRMIRKAELMRIRHSKEHDKQVGNKE